MGVRLQMSKPVRLSYGKVTYVGTLWISVVLLLVLSGELSAGSIFMKNGYIIQGRIVDRDVDGVILGWPNGKVTIEHRFVQEVVYEPDEEERILLLEKVRQEGENPDEDIAILIENPTEMPALPASLEILKARLNTGGSFGGAGSSERPTSEEPFGADDPVFTSDEIPTTDVFVEEFTLGEVISSDVVGISLRPPKGWQDKSNDEFLAFVAEPGDDGFASSFNVVSMLRGPLSIENFTEILKADQDEKIDSFELLSEGPTSVAGTHAYETVGSGERNGQAAVFRQVVLVGESRAWLFSMFTADKTEMDPDAISDSDQDMAIMEKALASVELLGSADEESTDS